MTTPIETTEVRVGNIIGYGDSTHPDPPPPGLGAFAELRVDLRILAPESREPVPIGTGFLASDLDFLWSGCRDLNSGPLDPQKQSARANECVFVLRSPSTRENTNSGLSAQ